MLVTVTLGASGDGAGVAGPEPGVNRCLFAPVAVAALFRTGAGTKSLEQRPWEPGPSWLSPLPALATSPEGSSAGATLGVWVLSMDHGTGCGGWVTETDWAASDTLPVLASVMLPPLCSDIP